VLVRDGEEAAASWVERFVTGDPPFLLSSALPYDEEQSIAFVPRPQRRPAVDEEAEQGWDAKVLKRVEYVDAAILPWFRGEHLEAPPVARAEVLVAGSARKSEGEAVLWRGSYRPGVTLDRATSASQVYATVATSYACSLAVYVLAESETELSAIESLLDVLARTGIGGRRSRGLGGFTWRRREAAIPLSARPVGMALSLVWPRRDELESEALSPAEGLGYRLVERQSWLSSPAWSSARSRTLTLIGEGSYLNSDLAPCIGGLADVTPTDRGGRHAVFRYGFGLFLDEGL
jgi:CRISPR type III-A-associated RAMP protein Csm4